MNIFKTISASIFFGIVFFNGAISVNANWDCGSPYNTSTYDYLYTNGRQDRAECIRGRNWVANNCDASNWSKNCTVLCTTSGCGSCEARCAGPHLYYADIWFNGGVQSQTCTKLDISKNDYVNCVPSATIAYPATGSSFTQGSNITFFGTGFDPNNDVIDTYMWAIRTSADDNAGNYSNTIWASGAHITRNDLNTLGDYTIYFSIKDSTNVWSKWKYINITIVPPLAVPMVDLKINNSDGPVTVNSGDNLNITWGAVSNATSCSSTGAGWTYSPPSSPSVSGGSDNVSATTTSTYTIQCTGPGGTGSDSVQVNILPPAPVVDLKINNSDGPVTVNSGDNLNITWGAVSNATSCSSTGAGWVSSPPGLDVTGGSDNVSATTTSTYTIQCTGPGGTGSDSVQVALCTPDYKYECKTNTVCTNTSDCGSTQTPTNYCLVSDNNSCVAPTTQPASVCVNNGVTCPATGTPVACPACPNESNWIEVSP